MKKVQKHLIAIVVTFCLMFAVACSNEGGTGSNSTKTADVYFGQTEYSVNAGETLTLNLQGDTAGGTVVWRSSNNAVATVSGGVVKGLLKGSTNITASVNGCEAVCKVNVLYEGGTESDDAVYSVRLNCIETSICPQNSATIRATVYKDNYIVESAVDWSVSDPSVLQYETNGDAIVVTGLKFGESKVIARAGRSTATCTVNVEDFQTVILSANSGEMTTGGDAYQLEYRAYKNGVSDTDAEIEWSSSDETVATVNASGLVTAVGGGETNIKAVYAGKEAIFSLKVYDVIEIGSKEDFMKLGKKADDSAYTESEMKYINYVLTTDLSFTKDDYTWVDTSDFGVSTTATGYLMEKLGSVLDGKGHSITVDLGSWEVRIGKYTYPTLFREITANGVLRNTKLTINTHLAYESSAVAIRNYGLIENCYIKTYTTHRWTGEYAKFYANRSGAIVENHGTIRKCVFNISVFDSDKYVYCSYAVRISAAGSTFEDNSIISESPNQQFISTNYGSWNEIYGSLAVGNADPYRDNCYVFASASDLLSGDGGKYKADGNIKSGTYTEVKDLYTGSYWSAWLA